MRSPDILAAMGGGVLLTGKTEGMVPTYKGMGIFLRDRKGRREGTEREGM